MPKKNTAEIKNTASKFMTDGEPFYCEPYGNGHINHTYLVKCRNSYDKQVRYILQAVNNTVFKQPEKLIDNVCRVTEFLKRNEPDRRRVLTLVNTEDGGWFFCDREGNFWRMYEFAEDSVCIERPDSKTDFYECAYAFGKFQRDLDGFPADTLFEAIPDFHNTEKRYADFLKALEEDRAARAKSVQREAEFIKSHEKFYSLLSENHKAGILPLRVTHNDTKSNNVLLDAQSRKALCVIDLDTVMPGFSVTDFGDAIRFGANTAAEDEKELDKVGLDMDLFEAYTSGYCDGCEGRLLNSEIMLLPEGAQMMTIECGMRFLTDYLNGDTYFKTDYPEHNLVRCHTQLKLFDDMLAHTEQMKNIVQRFCRP